MFPNRLREERVIRRVRQFDLVVKTGLNQAKISFIENGLVQPKPREKEKLAKALGCSVDAVFPEK
jgi:transcriptional regulator with XRE-family HTH domain